MESAQAVKRQLETGPPAIDDEGGKTINVASNGSGGVTLTDSASGNDESAFKLQNQTTPPESVTYQGSSQTGGFSLQFSATPAPVTLNGVGSSCGSGCFQAAQQTDDTWKLVLQASNAANTGSDTPPGKAYTYTVTLGTGESHDPTMDIEC